MPSAHPRCASTAGSMPPGAGSDASRLRTALAQQGPPGIGGLGVAVLDGHESHASFRRCCQLEATVQRRDGQQCNTTIAKSHCDSPMRPPAQPLRLSTPSRARRGRDRSRLTVCGASSRPIREPLTSCWPMLSTVSTAYWGMAKTPSCSRTSAATCIKTSRAVADHGAPFGDYQGRDCQ